MRDVIKAYVGLTKPRIIELLLITTVPVMFLAAGGVPGLGVVAATLVGGILASGSANTINCVLDRDIDEQMRRTRRRPLPRHAVSPRSATIFGVVLGVLATLELGFCVNWLSSVLALAANAFYVFGYTMVLKRRTVQNIVWGGIAGCFPTLIGWTAVTNYLAWTPLVLFGVVFFWTPPHTWALAMRYREDYASVDVPMLPVVATPVQTARQILAYSIVMVITSLALWPVGDTGWVYPAGRDRPRRRLPPRSLRPPGPRQHRRRRPSPPPDAPVPLLQHLPGPPLHRRSHRPPRPLVLRGPTSRCGV